MRFRRHLFGHKTLVLNRAEEETLKRAAEIAKEARARLTRAGILCEDHCLDTLLSEVEQAAHIANELHLFIFD